MCLLKQSQDIKVGTSIAYMCHKISLQLVSTIEVWLSGTAELTVQQYPPRFVQLAVLIVFQILFKKTGLLELFLFLLFVISFCCCIPYFVFTVVMCFVWLYLLFLFCILVYFVQGIAEKQLF